MSLSAEQILEAVEKASIRCRHEAEQMSDVLARSAANSGAETLRALWQELKKEHEATL